MTRKQNRIQLAQRRVEREVLAHVRKVKLYRPVVPGDAWGRAFGRLMTDGRLRYSAARGGFYIPRKRTRYETVVKVRL